METEIENAIERLAKKITEDIESSDAQRLTQAALNLAHTAQVLKNTKESK